MNTIHLRPQPGTDGLVYSQTLPAKTGSFLVLEKEQPKPKPQPGAITLRPYQEDCLNGIRENFKAGNRRVILCAPTGAGKTRMFSYMVATHLKLNLMNRALVLTNRIELLTQAGGALYDVGLVTEELSAGRKKRFNRRARCVVGMVETYNNWIEEMPDLANFTLIIIDECHAGHFKKLFAKWDLLDCKALIIGATATPIASAKNDPLSNYYQALVARVQIPELVEQGFLSPCTTYAPKIDKSKLKKDNKGEYTDQSQLDTFATRSVYDGILTRYQELCDKYNAGQPMKTICFNVNIQHSLEVTDMLNAAGISARHVDGTTPPDQRQRILDDYKAGRFYVVNNVGILNAGFDDPTTVCIIFNRATTSVSLWLQSCGRGSRIAPGKDRFFVLDMGENWRELQLWDAVRDWSAIWDQGAKKSNKVGVAPAKDCPECEAIIPLSARVCPECGYVYPEKEKGLAEAVEFVEITKEMAPAPKYSPAEVKEILKLNRRELLPTVSVVDLAKIQEVKKYANGWIIHKINDRAESEEDFKAQLKEYAELKGYHPRWPNRYTWQPKVEAEEIEGEPAGW